MSWNTSHPENAIQDHCPRNVWASCTYSGSMCAVEAVRCFHQLALQEGDHVYEVNGITGSAIEMAEACKKDHC
eukprot:6482267-Amphidinium_carterae.2